MQKYASKQFHIFNLYDMKQMLFLLSVSNDQPVKICDCIQIRALIIIVKKR